MAAQTQSTELQTVVPVPLYSPWIQWVTFGSVSACSVYLLGSLLTH